MPRRRRVSPPPARLTILRNAFRLHEKALADPALRLGGNSATVALGHRAVRLTPSGLRRVHRKLREVYEVLGEEHDERGVPFAVTLGLAPA